MEDIIIIGGGIIGSLIAYNCARYHCNVLLIDKENDIANATSMANSAIIHAGYDPEDGTLKAAMNLRGARLYPSLCRDLKVDYKQIGSLVVASDEKQCERLRELQTRAEKRGIAVQLLQRDEIVKMEENIADEVKEALYCPQTAIVTPWKVAIAAVEVAIANGVKCILNEEVIAIDKENDVFTVTTSKNSYQSKMVINCAGLYADEINEMATGQRDFTISPKKGEYFVLDKTCHDFVKHVIYPTPSDAGKGVLVVPTVHGNIMLGPNAMIHDQKDDVSTSLQGLDYVKENVTKIVKNVPYEAIIHRFSGNRPVCDRHDFIIEESKVANFINVAGMESPGLASAPAIAEKVMQDFILKRFDLSKRLVVRHRQKNVVIRECSESEKQKYIDYNPRYGEIVCRCEQVSAQEIIDCIKRNCGARSVVGVKKRVRPGMGKCQGGFCEPMVIKLLSDVLKIPMEEVDYNQANSPVLVKKSEGEDA